MEESILRVYADGVKVWRLNGDIHREDVPAAEYPDGTKYWYIKDKLHREDGPAAIYPDGKTHWFLEGKEVSEKLHNQLVKMKLFW